jgi:hypothetical protein
VKFKVPKSLAVCADLYYQTRQKRLAIEKSTEDLREQERILKEHLIQSLPKSQAQGIAGKVCRVQVVVKPIPKVGDPKAFAAFCKRKGNEDLMSHSMNPSAVKVRWENGVVVPGIERFNVVDLSFNKL